ncbi:fha domain-containing protein ddl [Phtheirospermum japonicum]|uniref:Fha domain-containing protein ddl n=1 Tax=Phtheirospermum japonicum TaxID=374723 RepID=A0A830BVG5_9LAMI|nr:fha domain-containing protein ddl [Phtheirospermum japonicum]
MGRHNSESPVRAHVSPRRKSPTRREKSPARHRSSNSDKLSTRNREKPAISRSPIRQKPSNRNRSPKQEKSRPSPPLSPPREKPSSRTRSPKRVKPRSSVSPSPSPRSKRLKRVTAERDAQKGSEREREKNNHGRKGDRAAHEEKDDKKDRRSERNAVGNASKSKRGRSHSPSDRHHRGQRRSRSPDNRGRNERTNSRDSEQRNGDSDSVAKMKAVEETLDAKEKQKPSFELSGKLAAETNRVRGVTLLFNEPPDARKPEIRWRLYVFKGGEALTEPLYVHRQSCYLFGRERRVADIPTDHPSCSKQHAVLQYRQVEEENPDGTMSKRVRPYMMDLGSTNGTFINDNQMEPQRYYELFEKDTIKFGNSR